MSSERTLIAIERRKFLAATGALLGAAPAAAGAALPASAASTPLPQVAGKDNAHEVLCGPMVPVITHYNRDLSLDLGALQSNLRFLVEHGVRNGRACLLVGGAGGDFPMLSTEERKAVAQAAVKTVEGRVPIVIGAQATDERVIIELAEYADSIGAYGVQVSPPYYFEPSDDDVLRLFRKLDGSVRKCGIMVYNTWWHGYDIPLPVLDQLADLGRVVSIKWSSPDGSLGYMQGVARYASKLAVIDNNNTWPLTSLLGGTGFITHLTSAWPEHDLELYSLTRAGQHKKAMDLMRTMDWPFIEFRGKMAKRISGEGSVVRAAMEICGRPGGPSRPPARELTSEERAELRSVLKRIGAPVA